MVGMAISSGETVDPPNRQTDSRENDDAQDGEPERQVAGPAGCQFHGGFPPVAPEPSFRTLPHRQERLNAQTWPVHQFGFQHTTGGGAAELSIKGVGRDRLVCACAPPQRRATRKTSRVRWPNRRSRGPSPKEV